MASGREAGQGGSGITGWIHHNLSGGDRPVAKPDFYGTGSVGKGWQDYLTKLYSTDIADSPQYVSESTSLRDALARNSVGQSQQLSDATNAGGFYDSGARIAGLGEINRGQQFHYAQGLTEILGRLEHEKLGAAFPFLQQQLGEYQAYYGARLGEENAGNFRAQAVASDILQGFSLGMGGGGSKPSGGYT